MSTPSALSQKKSCDEFNQGISFFLIAISGGGRAPGSAVGGRGLGGVAKAKLHLSITDIKAACRLRHSPDDIMTSGFIYTAR